MKKKNLCILIILCFQLFTGCGQNEETINGKWVLSQLTYTDGTVIKAEDVNTYECYEVNGDKAYYTCIAEGIGKTEFELQVEQNSDNEYSFKLNDRIVFCTPKLDGDIFSYSLGDKNQTVTFSFKKQE